MEVGVEVSHEGRGGGLTQRPAEPGATASGGSGAGAHSDLPAPGPGLAPNVVSLWGLISQSLAGMAPACDVVAFMTAGAAFALVALPLSYLAAFILMFIEVNTLYHLSKHRGGAGGYYSYVAQGLGPGAAVLTGFMVTLYQILSVAGIPVYIGGVFLPGLAAKVGINLPAPFWFFVIVIFIAVPWLLSVIGIRPSIKILAFASGIEILFLVVASAVIVGLAHPTQPLQPFEIGSVGVRGVALGMIFAVTSFIGIGSHAPLGDETKGISTQKGRLIGKAAMISLTLVGVALTISAYALTVGWGELKMGTFATANAPGVTVFLHYLGPVGAIALVVLALNSAMMDSLALLTSSSRVLYAIGRDNLINTRFALVNGRRAPARSVSLLAGSALVIAAGAWLLVGAVSAFELLTTAVLFGLVTAHTLMNASLIRLSWGEHGPHKLLLHFGLPVVATLLFWFVLFESFWPITYPLEWSAVLWLVVLLPSVWYARHVAKRVPTRFRHLLGIRHDDVLVAVIPGRE
ncbi:MAG: APC family permease [Candidatus Dormibacteria bacterium]